MEALSFDTLRYSKKMASVGFTQEQAEAMAEEQRALIDEKLATKRDLKELEQRVIIKLGSVVLAATTVLIAVIAAAAAAIVNLV